MMFATAPDALKQNDIIVNKRSVIVLTGNCNASGSTLEAEVFSRKDGSKNVRSYNVDALFANIDAGWTLYRTVDCRTTAPAPLPELVAVSCDHCEEGYVCTYPGTEYEHWQACNNCGSTGFVELCSQCDEPSQVVDGEERCGCEVICETCDMRVSLSHIVDAGVCKTCFDKMAETIRREADDYTAFIAEQLEFGRSVNWL